VFSCERPKICHPIILLLCVEVEESSFLIQRHVIGCLSRCGTQDLILLVEIGKSQKKKRRSETKGKPGKETSSRLHQCEWTYYNLHLGWNQFRILLMNFIISYVYLNCCAIKSFWIFYSVVHNYEQPESFSLLGSMPC